MEENMSVIRLTRKYFNYHRLWLIAAMVLTISLAPLENVGAFPGNPPAGVPPTDEFAVQVVSSSPKQVTGGDARIHIQVPRVVPFQQVDVLVNGVDESGRFTLMPGSRTLTGVIDGLQVGQNTLTVQPNGNGNGRPSPVTLSLTDYPITGPIFSGPHQYPFVCTVQTSGLGEPLVDNQTTGIPVHDNSGQVIGYSQDCSIQPRVDYMYKSTDGSFKPYTLGEARPADMAQTTTLDGLTVDYIVRWERGTINRFIYSIAMLAPNDRGPWQLDRSAWNGRLIFHLQGGVGIGHSQGVPSNSNMLYDQGLSKGYAVIYSTGDRTDTHYNLVLGGETALMVKERFIERYDTPLYTVGVGGSGGAIQQYIYAQDYPGLIDAAIPQYSYPDMVTQAVHVGDCELLEYYMDVLDASNPLWSTWTNRTLLIGLNGSNTEVNPYTGQPGSDECVNGWRGLSPLALNPNYGQAPNQSQFIPQSAIAAIKWTHFDDLVNIFGTDANGYANRYWDNVGVQYGLESVASGKISPDEFLKLNASIGGWKSSEDMVQEGSPFYPPGKIDLSNWDPWSSRNQVFSTNPQTAPAPRTQGDIQAMQAAYESGLVFMGNIGIPVIDWRNYLEPELNMHNSQQSFDARQRIRDARGNSDNQIVWFTNVVSGTPIFDQTPEALDVMDQWMMNILAHPELGVAGNKPAQAVDSCFDANGNLIASGDNVWDGILDNNPQGVCTQNFPIHQTSRIVAGGPFKGSIFKCQLKSVDQSVADGDYGVWTPTSAQIDRLKQIFPTGVCDFSKPDAGLPPGWTSAGP
jgi:hypothetical protein